MKVLRLVKYFFLLFSLVFIIPRVCYADVTLSALQSLDSQIVGLKENIQYHWYCDGIYQDCVYAENRGGWQAQVLPIVFRPALLIPMGDWQRDVTYRATDYDEFDWDQEMIRQSVIAQVPALLTANDWQRAVLLRNYVYPHAGIGNMSAPLTFSTFNQIVTDKNPQLCGGLSLLYMGLLKILDIPAHVVNMGSDNAYNGSAPGDTHVAVEVFLNSHWVLQDPTFNIHWEIYGEPVDAITLTQGFIFNPFVTLQKILHPFSKNGVEQADLLFLGYLAPVSISDNCLLLDGRLLSDYEIGYDDLLSNIEIADVNIFGESYNDQKIISTFPRPFSWRYKFQMVENERINIEKIFNSLELIHKWSFLYGVPSDGTTTDDSLAVDNRIITNAGGVLLNSGKGASDYQMVSNPIQLAAGDYILIVDGEVKRGGMELGVLDCGINKFIRSNCFYSKLYNGKMYVQFKLENPTSVKFIMANFSYQGYPSVWEIKKVLLGRLNVLAAFYFKPKFSYSLWSTSFKDIFAKNSTYEMGGRGCLWPKCGPITLSNA